MVTFAEISSSVSADTLLDLLIKRKKKLPWTIQTSLARWVARRSHRDFPHAFDNVESYCTFIGHSRSGHSLIAALLDANPNIVMAHEFRAIRYIQASFDRDSLYYLLLQNTRIRGHSWQRGNGYTYHVEGQWQGAFEKIKVIGDKHGEMTVKALASDLALLNKIKQTVKVPVKLIHVVRNPFDNIATMALKESRKSGLPLDLQATIDRYFKVCESVTTVERIADNSTVLTLRHENFVRDPESQLRNLCVWLGVDYSEDYLSACASIVFESPHKSRNKVEWSPSDRRAVEQGIGHFSFLSGYCFENGSDRYSANRSKLR